MAIVSAIRATEAARIGRRRWWCMDASSPPGATTRYRAMDLLQTGTAAAEGTRAPLPESLAPQDRPVGPAIQGRSTMHRSIIDKSAAAIGAALLIVALSAAPALACGGRIGPNAAVTLLQTTTLAAYHDGAEHYVTAFQFAGGGGAFGSLTPLPGIPSSVEKGGDWTLQRLAGETEPQELTAVRPAAPAATGAAEEIMKVRIDALDVTVLRGGAEEGGPGASTHGFCLPPA